MERAQSILKHGMDALQRVSEAMDEEFSLAVDRIVKMRGALVVSGIGKAGLIGRKLSATFASTGTRSHFLHPAEALHGDLGCVGATDVMLILSNSGTTKEVTDILPFLSRRVASIIAITSGANSPLARASDVCLTLPPLREACQHNLAPTTSTLAMLALGDALAMVVSESKGFKMDDFAELHPGGALGRKLTFVDDVMRPLTDCRIGTCTQTIRQTLVEVSKPGRRSGAVMVVDELGRLCGIFTDSDLARMLEQRRDAELDASVSTRMTTSFSAVQCGARLSDAIQIMTQRKISELPVIDAQEKPVGMIDITDLLGLSPATTDSKFAISRIQEESGTEAPQESPVNEENWHEEPTSLRIFGPIR